MGLVNDKAHHVPGQQQLLNGAGAQLFRGDIEDSSQTVGHPLQGFGPLYGAEQAVDGDGIHQPVLVQVVHLILHQGLEGGYDHCQPVFRLARHQGGELEGDGLPAPGGEHRQQGFPRHRRLHRPLLERLTAIGAEPLEAEQLFQLPVNPKRAPAVGAPGLAGLPPQRFHYVLDLGVVPHQPRRGDRVTVPTPDQGQSVGQLHRPAGDQAPEVRVLTDLSRELPPDGPLRGGEQRAVFQEREETPEFLKSVQQPVVDLLPAGGQPVKRVYLIVKQLPGLFRVIQRVVSLISLELVVLHQGVVRAFREQERREV